MGIKTWSVRSQSELPAPPIHPGHFLALAVPSNRGNYTRLRGDGRADEGGGLENR
jgi:hypothetical protein